jgi:hypothetical protein
LSFGLFAQPSGGLALWTSATSSSGAFFAYTLGTDQPFPPLEQRTFLEVAVGEPLQPRVELTPLTAPVPLDVRTFTRASATSPIGLMARLVMQEPYDSVDIAVLIVNETGTVLQDLGAASAVADAGGVFAIQLAGATPATAAARAQRSLQLRVTAKQGAAPVFIDTYVFPLTLVSSQRCIELLHLLPPGAPAPAAVQDIFGCPTAPDPDPSPDPSPDPDPDLAALTARIAALESLVASLTTIVDQLEADRAGLATRVDTLERALGSHSHTYLSGSGAGHNSNLAETGPADFPSAPEPQPISGPLP